MIDLKKKKIEEFIYNNEIFIIKKNDRFFNETCNSVYHKNSNRHMFYSLPVAKTTKQIINDFIKFIDKPLPF